MEYNFSIDNQSERNQAPELEPDITIVQAQIIDLAEKVEKIETTVEKQRSESRDIIIGVLLAAFLVFIVLAIEIVIFHTQYSSIEDKYQQKIEAIEAEIMMTKESKIKDSK